MQFLLQNVNIPPLLTQTPWNTSILTIGVDAVFSRSLEFAQMVWQYVEAEMQAGAPKGVALCISSLSNTTVSSAASSTLRSSLRGQAVV